MYFIPQAFLLAYFFTFFEKSCNFGAKEKYLIFLLATPLGVNSQSRFVFSAKPKTKSIHLKFAKAF